MMKLLRVIRNMVIVTMMMMAMYCDLDAEKTPLMSDVYDVAGKV